MGYNLGDLSLSPLHLFYMCLFASILSWLSTVKLQASKNILCIPRDNKQYAYHFMQFPFLCISLYLCLYLFLTVSYTCICLYSVVGDIQRAKQSTCSGGCMSLEPKSIVNKLCVYTYIRIKCLYVYVFPFNVLCLTHEFVDLLQLGVYWWSGRAIAESYQKYKLQSILRGINVTITLFHVTS